MGAQIRFSHPTRASRVRPFYTRVYLSLSGQSMEKGLQLSSRPGFAPTHFPIQTAFPTKAFSKNLHWPRGRDSQPDIADLISGGNNR